MRHFFEKIQIFLFVILTAGFSPILVDKIIAKVENENIFLSELEEIYDASKNSNQLAKKNRKEILKSIVESKILLALAKKSEIKISQSEIDTEAESRFKMMLSTLKSEAALEKYFGKKISEIKLWIKKSVEEQMFVELFKRKLISNIETSPKKIKEYFSKNRVDIVLPATYILQDITINSSKYLDELEIYMKKFRKHKKDVIEKKTNFSNLTFINEPYIEDEINNSKSKKKSQKKNINKNSSEENKYSNPEINLSQTKVDLLERNLLEDYISVDEKNLIAVAIRMKPGDISEPFIDNNKIYMLTLIEKNFPKIILEFISLAPSETEFIKNDSEKLNEIKEKVNNNNENFEILKKKIPTSELEKSIYGGSEYEYADLSFDLILDIEKSEFKDQKVYGPYIEKNKNKNLVRIIYLKKYNPSRNASIDTDYKVFVDQYVNSLQNDIIQEALAKGYQTLNIWVDEIYK